MEFTHSFLLWVISPHTPQNNWSGERLLFANFSQIAVMYFISSFLFAKTITLRVFISVLLSGVLKNNFCECKTCYVKYYRKYYFNYRREEY